MSQAVTLREQLLSQNPTDNQKDAIFANELEFLLRASPGSGKTWTSCRRFIWRGANWNYRVGGLALLSFTNVAIREFQEATISLGQRQLLSEPNYVGTFDSFVERFIITPFGHLDSSLDVRPRLFIAPRPGDWKNKKILAWVNVASGRTMPVPAWEIIPYYDDNSVAYRASNKFGGKTLEFGNNNPVDQFLALGFYTHAQRVYLACRLLLDRPHIASCIARRFPEIVVDEAQDTNVWLLILLNTLREKGVKVTLIGDPDQCIFEFAMADATSLLVLKEQWNIPEMPLNKSFRCNNSIADAVKNIGGNNDFVGCAPCQDEYRRPFVYRISGAGPEQCISAFENLLDRAHIPHIEGAILCRAHHQLESIRGKLNYANLKGLTKEFAQAAFYRDIRRDHKKAMQIVERAIREMTNDPDFWVNLDNSNESEEMERAKLILWRFTKSPQCLPPVSDNSQNWISCLRSSLTDLFLKLGISDPPKMGQKIRKTGLVSSQLSLPLFEPRTLFPSIRQETIHQVKGESIDGVLVLGSSQFFNLVVRDVESGKNTEDRRLAYVAMTRARHTLLIGLPASHYDKYISSWEKWGFGVL